MDGQPPPQTTKSKVRARLKGIHSRLSRFHARIPYLRKLPLAAILIIALLVLVNLVAWAICGLILTSHTSLLSTAALAYTLGLRHALDADHISAIDLMTRRLIATGQRPVTVGTFFSLGHSTIVIVTSIVVAATAAGVSRRFSSFGNIGGIIGSSVSAAFLILLGVMNAYILYRLVVQIKKVIRLQPDQEAAEAWKIEGGGCLFRVLKRMFRLIDRPWKMYPLGVLFGLGFDTSSEIALLGISSIQAAKGTSMWLILVFPLLFTAGMCLVDTIDGALMMSLYVAPMSMGGDDKKDAAEEEEEDLQQLDQPIPTTTIVILPEADDVERRPQPQADPPAPTSAGSNLRTRVKDPLTFLYYSIVLTTLTVMCAIIIGTIQLLTMILNVAHPSGPFWDGVETAGDNYELIGGSICASFVVFGGISVLCNGAWRRWVERERLRLRLERELTQTGSRRARTSWEDQHHDQNQEPGQGQGQGQGQGRSYADYGTVEDLVEMDGKTGAKDVRVTAYDRGSASAGASASASRLAAGS